MVGNSYNININNLYCADTEDMLQLYQLMVKISHSYSLFSFYLY